MKKLSALRPVLVLALGFCTAASAAVVSVAGPGEAVAYLEARQNVDGGFGETGGGSDPLITCWVLISGKAAAEDPLNWRRGGPGPAEYLATRSGDLVELIDIEMYALALATAGGDPGSVGGKDLVAMIRANQNPGGRIGADLEEHCWGTIALAAAGLRIPPECTGWLIGQQRSDGGWGDSEEAAVETTAAAVQALAASGEKAKESLSSAMRFLKGRMLPDGGFSSTGARSDAYGTAFAINAIVAAGQDPSSEAWAFQGANPAGYLASLQAGDGHYRYDAATEAEPAAVTAVATTAAAGKALPLAGPASGASQQAGRSSPAELGKVGASTGGGSGVTSAPDSPDIDVVVTGGVKAGASAMTGLGHGAFWVFLCLCAGYLLVLCLVAVLVVTMTRRRPVAPGPRRGDVSL